MQPFLALARIGVIALLVTSGVTLSGCFDKCVGVNCAPCNGLLDDITVVFDRDSLQGGFRKAEINGAYAVRYSAPGFTNPIDTVWQTRGGADFYGAITTLRRLPWPALPVPYDLGSYSFRFVLPAANRTYSLSSIEVQAGAGGGDICCDCGTNKRRRFVLNGVAVVADGTTYDERAAIIRR
ncbi:hypothetical protein [Hymenobacter daeguensis]